MKLSKSIVMLSIGALIMAYYVSSEKISYTEFMEVLYNETMEYKHPRCFQPEAVTRSDPHKVYSALATLTIKRWFYDPSTRACRPLFTAANYTYPTDSKNYNLPNTRMECETLCGSFCLVDHADGKTEMGICMSLGFGGGMPNSCKSVLPEAHPKQCPQLYSKCCPRSYQHLINTPVTSPTAAPAGVSSNRQNKSMSDAVAWESYIYKIGSLST